MRWLDRDKPNTLGALSWVIINEYVDYLISSTADAGWSGVGNTGRICHALATGIVPDFNREVDGNAAMIRQIKLLTVRDKGLGWLFDDLTKMQKLCLLSAVLAEGRRTSQGKALSNARIAATLPVFAAELRLGPPRAIPSEKTFANNVVEGRKRFLLKLKFELAAKLDRIQARDVA